MAHWLLWLLGALLVGVDQFTKYRAVLALKGQESLVLIPGVLEFSYVENTGAAFGIMQDCRWLFIVLTALVLAFMLYWLFKGKFAGYPFMEAAAMLIVAGGIGNMIDRLIHGYVVDFISVVWIHFPVFNFADCCVVVGAAILLIQFLFVYQLTEKDEAVHGEENASSHKGTDGKSG